MTMLTFPFHNAAAQQAHRAAVTGSYPPGVTQRHIDEAAGGYDEWQRCTVCGQLRDAPCRKGDCGNEPDEFQSLRARQVRT
jgi:hypothetical protein